MISKIKGNIFLRFAHTRGGESHYESPHTSSLRDYLFVIARALPEAIQTEYQAK